MPREGNSNNLPIEVSGRKSEKMSWSDRLKEIKQKGLENLDRRGGFIEIKTDKDGMRVIVFDEEAYTKKKVIAKTSNGRKTLALSDEIKNTCDALYNDKRFGSGKIDRALFYLFDGETVVSKDDFKGVVKNRSQVWAVSELPKKDFFYVPKDENAAIKTKAIRDAKNFYFLYGLGAERDEIYPTRKTGFKGKLKLPEVILPMLIYGQYDGERDKNGILWIKNKLNGEVVQERISSKWLKDVARYRIDGKMKPRDYLERMCPNLMESGLLRKADFKEKAEAGTVSGAGLVTLDRVRHSVGKRYVGWGYSFDIDSSEVKLTNPKTSEVHIKNYSIDKRRAKITGKNGAYLTRPNEGVIERTTYRIVQGVTEAEKVEISIVDETPNLDELKRGLESMGAPEQIFEQYTLEEQIQVSSLLSKMDKYAREKCKGLIVDNGDSFLTLLRDIARFGNFDYRLLKLAEVENSLNTELLNNYALAEAAVDDLASKLSGDTGDTKSIVLIDRISSAFKAKAAELVVAQLEGLDVMNQFELMNEALGAFVAIYQKSPEYERSKSWYKNFEKRKSKVVASVTAVYNGTEGKEGQKIKVTFRPRAQFKDGKQVAQARMGVVYKNAAGDEFRFRVDLDDEKWGGASLDIGDSEGVIGKALKEIGSGHHITAQFEKAFSNNEVFAALIKDWARKLGYDFSKRS